MPRTQLFEEQMLDPDNLSEQEHNEIGDSAPHHRRGHSIVSEADHEDVVVSSFGLENSVVISSVDLTRSVVTGGLYGRGGRGNEQWDDNTGLAQARIYFEDSTHVKVERDRDASGFVADGVNSYIPIWAIEFASSMGATAVHGTSVLAAGTNTISTTIATVDLTKSILFFSYGHNDSNPRNMMIAGQLSAADTVRFQRHAAGGSPEILVRWTVMSFTSGVDVQRGSKAMNLREETVAINGVALDRSIVTISAREDGSIIGGDDFFCASFDASNTLRFTMSDSVGPAGGTTIEWQVVEFDVGVAEVESGTSQILPGGTTETATLSTTHPLGKTWVVYTYCTPTGDAPAPANSNMIACQQTDTTTLTFTRAGTASTFNIPWFAVKFLNDTVVQEELASFSELTEGAVLYWDSVLGKWRAGVVAQVESPTQVALTGPDGQPYNFSEATSWQVIGRMIYGGTDEFVFREAQYAVSKSRAQGSCSVRLYDPIAAKTLSTVSWTDQGPVVLRTNDLINLPSAITPIEIQARTSNIATEAQVSAVRLMPTTDLPDVPATPTPDHYWGFEEPSYNGTAGEVIDSVGTWNGTALNGATTIGDGTRGQVAFFSATDHGYAIGNQTPQPGQTGITISFWVNIAGYISNRDAFIVCHSSANNTVAAGHHWSILVDKDDNRLTFRLRTDLGNSSEKIPAAFALTLGAWTHYVCRWNGTLLEVFKDGELAGAAGRTGVLRDSISLPVMIGTSFGENRGFSGRLDDLRIFNRALTDIEVIRLYDGT
jgi:hypothetical protein